MDNINFNKERNTYSFYSLKELAWHRLGTVVEDAKTVEEIVKIANLDYRVEKLPILVDYKNCYSEDDFERVKVKRFNNFYATTRLDTQEIFSIVSDRYEVIQNETIISLINKMIENSDNKLRIETAGVLGQGERIFVSAKMTSDLLLGEDIDRYLLFTSSHDGTLSFKFFVTNIRVVCNNTLQAALNGNNDYISFKHTEKVNNEIEQFKIYLDVIDKNFQDVKELYSVAANYKVDNLIKEDFISTLIFNSKELNHFKQIGNINQVDSEIISTRKQNTFISIDNAIEQGIGQDTNRGSMYWLYNGITTYLQNIKEYKNDSDMFNKIIENRNMNKDAFNYMFDKIA